MTTILYLFPDTNLFMQCRALEELGWEQWSEFDEIHLVVSRPVQKEIDKHKSSGGERLARRGKKAASLLRDVIIGGGDHKLIREGPPQVRLYVKTDIKPSEALADKLSYHEPDDQLVGAGYAFRMDNPGSDVRILTHDGGPMASAKMVGMAIAVIPDEWFLPPEQSESDKRIRSLEAEVARLKQAEPDFSIASLNLEGKENDALEDEVVFYEPITDAELASMMGELKERFPIATDFGPREKGERVRRQGPASFGIDIKEVFAPATGQAIADYHEEHKKWLAQCEKILRSLHTALRKNERPPIFVFRASNNGTRPAEDALVTITATGNFSIMPPPSDDDNGEERRSPVKLPAPPAAPAGTWTAIPAALSMFNNPDLVRALTGFAAPVTPSMPFHGLSDILSPRIPKPRDPNAFYYKDRPQEPVRAFSVECRQWRHGVAPELFAGQIVVSGEAETLTGAIHCEIHAANASEVAKITLPIQVKVKYVKALDIAKNLIGRIGFI